MTDKVPMFNYGSACLGDEKAIYDVYSASTLQAFPGITPPQPSSLRTI